MPNWIAFATDLQAAVYNELCEMHDPDATETSARERLAKLIGQDTFWESYIAPMLDRVCDDSGFLDA